MCLASILLLGTYKTKDDIKFDQLDLFVVLDIWECYKMVHEIDIYEEYDGSYKQASSYWKKIVLVKVASTSHSKIFWFYPYQLKKYNV